MDRARTLRSIRILIGFFMAALAASGLTAIPLRAELEVANRIIARLAWTPAPLAAWLRLVAEAIDASLRDYPFLAYGTDWLAFAHLVIALAFLGAYRDPIRNRWVMEWGMLACLLVVPMALTFGALRAIPWWWRLIDCSFGALGLIPLWFSWRLSLRLEAS
jgi:hypothetical protein